MVQPSPQDLRNLASAVQAHNSSWHRPASAIDAGAGLRTLAALIDICFYFVTAIVLCLILQSIVDSRSAPWRELQGLWILQIVILSGAVVYLGCEVAFQFTPGKACLGLRVTAAQSNPSRRPLLLRWVFRCLPLIAAILLCVLMLTFLHFKTDSTFTAKFWSSDLLPSLLPLITLLIMYLPAHIIYIAGGPVWYDRLAGTRVVRRATPRSVRGFEPIMPG